MGLQREPISEEKPRSQKQELGHPLEVWRARPLEGAASGGRSFSFDSA
jgi:hypothetical protein